MTCNPPYNCNYNSEQRSGEDGGAEHVNWTGVHALGNVPTEEMGNKENEDNPDHHESL